ncbi:TerC family protein [Sphingomonas sp. NPDC019816]|jgi:tellurite resistance protein TerC|uniref:TerC family protein n=1 Tax=Alphaproteobacteria TaxID=28211 RepID=UPI000F7EF37F|nr:MULTISPECIES: TerC family protein [Alphaproteobacteria]RSV11663.1 TerC family protein [Sphingomonas sp. ABOLF]TAJ29094.1 MAG: TerC/Alx family metal homeostasis membrane protein [Bosea sp. (in: a-proteobacteria)]|tara:strand:- start:134 stop:1264 length:1131 start_codon:yes stop_codon:yes gene_type:complete
MDWLMTNWLGTPAWFWMTFIGLVAALTAFDLGVLNRRDREMSIRQSLLLSLFYISVALAFGLWVWAEKGADLGLKYYTGFVIEKALSIDNVFVISLIFSAFAIPRVYQYRALVWGIVAVLFLRGIMIGAGAAVVEQFHWVLYLFGAFLVASGIKMLVAGDQEPPDVGANPLVRFLSRHLRIAQTLDGNRFLTRIADPVTGKMATAATPLLLALIVINIADIVFAVDSVPAIFAITTDTFIVYTSNIMAILGLRALYFALSAMIHRFHHLSHALALVLVFIGAKIFIADFVLAGGTFPAWASLGITLGLITGGILFSLWKSRPLPEAGEGPHAPREEVDDGVNGALEHGEHPAAALACDHEHELSGYAGAAACAICR